MFACVIGVTRTRNIGIKKKKRHLLCVPDTDDVTKRKKNHETISSRFFTERKTERSFVGHLSGPARGFGYTVSRAILIQVYGIFWSKFGYKVFSFS